MSEEDNAEFDLLAALSFDQQHVQTSQPCEPGTDSYGCSGCSICAFILIKAAKSAVCMHLTHYYYAPGILPGSAKQCMLGNVYLRSNLSRKALFA